MNDSLYSLLDDLLQYSEQSPPVRAEFIRRSGWIAQSDTIEALELMQRLAEIETDDFLACDEFLAAIVNHLAQVRRRDRGENSSLWLEASIPAAIERLYARLPDNARTKASLLALAAAGGTPAELDLFARLLVDSPPQRENDVAISLAPLFQFPDYDSERLFPALLAALAHPLWAAGILDLANFLVRRKLLAVHPAAAREAELRRLLKELTIRLQKLEARPEAAAASPQELSRTVAHGVSLAVSLCDSLALLNDREAIETLRETLTLRHRRVRTEAAAALARLGEDDGKTELLKLASEPIARLRVLAYADELGLTSQVEPEYQTPAARAEAELVLFLSEPTLFSLPPANCTLVDQRTIHWPGFEDPQECFLFRYEYRFVTEQGNTGFTNLALAGPDCDTVTADLADLPYDDIYALFAGRQARHEDIFEVSAAFLSESQLVEAARLERRLKDDAFEAIEPLALAYLFGEKSLAVRTKKAGIPGIAVASPDDILWLPSVSKTRPLGVDEAIALHRGRRLLRTFGEGA